MIVAKMIFVKNVEELWLSLVMQYWNQCSNKWLSNREVLGWES